MDNTTWHDCKPSHAPLPQAMIDARVAADKAIWMYNAACDDYMRQRIDAAELHEIGKTMDYLEERVIEISHAYHAGELVEQRWAAEDAHPAECTCNPRDGGICAACREVLPDGIPY